MIGDITEKLWDVIIIGAGLGGGTIGRRLAERGLSVLFAEAGPFGPHTEQHRIRDDVYSPAARLVRGYVPHPVHTIVNNRETINFGLLGAGVGGSSAFYAATLERPERHDIDHTAQRPHPTGGWPEKYDSFTPYFQQAEKLYSVCGEEDPLNADRSSSLIPPPGLSEADEAMTQCLRYNGLHPYHVHLGVRFQPDCQLCFGNKCPKACKMDGRSAGVEPALATGQAAILDMCEIRQLYGEKDRITHIEAIRGQTVFRLQARTYVLAGGALASPRLLLASKSDKWPQGCANHSGLVGRNLMFHLTELLALWPNRKVTGNTATKAISMRDFYYGNGERYGALADMGIQASYGEIAHFLNTLFDRSAIRKLAPLRQLTRVPAYIGSKLLGNAKIFGGLIEDLPYEENRVWLDMAAPERIKINYTMHKELYQRRRNYRQLIKRKMRGQRKLFLNYEPELNIPHACGTLRFGDDPAKSVLNRFCRAHDITNLYAADASFMPTSTGINPGLTIIANALRVGDHIISQMR